MKKYMKMKRYNEGDEVTADDDVEPEVIRRSYASGVRVNYDDDETPKRTKRFGKKSDDGSYDRKEKSRASDSSSKNDEEDTSAVAGRLRKKGSPGREATDREKAVMRGAELAAVAIPAAGVARGAMAVGKAAKRIRDISQASKAQELTAGESAMANRIRARQDMFGSGKAAREYAEAGGMKRGGSVKSSASRRADGIATKGKTKGRMI